MTNEEWEDLVRRLEPEAKRDPKGYARKVTLLGAVGYAFIGLMLLVLLALAALVVAGAIAGPGVLLKFLVPIGALIWILLRSLAVAMDPPDGISLRREDAPELFRMIDEVNEKVRGPKVHQVLIDDQPNAAIVQIPRRGVIFGQRNYLLLGLPYMQAMSPDEFRAVVAHELGHLSRNHGRFGSWIYRIRTTWWQLLTNLEQKRSWSTGIFRRFFEWYVPRFDAYSFPLRRAHEFEADDAAAAAAGPRPAMTSLVTGTLAARYLYEEYWPSVYRRVETESAPPRTAFSPIREEVLTAPKHESAEAWLKEALEDEGTVADTHPPLADRIRHLGLDPDEIVRSVTSNGKDGQPSAAAAYLGELETSLAEQLDAAWHESMAEDWRDEHEAQREARERLRDLDERAAREELSADDLHLRAQLTRDQRGDDDALPIYRELLERDPEDAPANYAVGAILLERGDEAGLRHLDTAIEADPEAVLPATELAYAFLQERGREGEAERYREQAVGRATELELAEAEREDIKTNLDRVRAHDLSQEIVDEIREQLAGYPAIKRAYLVRRAMDHLDDEFPVYVLYVIPKRRPWRPLGGDRGKLIDALEIESPVFLWQVSPAGFSTIPLRLRGLRGAEIYRA